MLAKAVESKDDKKASFYAYEIGKWYWEGKQHNQSIIFFIRCLDYSKKTGDSNTQYLANYSMGAVYSEIKKYDDAVDNFQKSLKIAKRLNDNALIAESLMNVGTAYGNSGRYKKAVSSLEEALSVAFELKDPGLQQNCYGLLAEYYQKTGDNKKSDEYFSRYNLIVQSRQNERNTAKQIDAMRQRIEHVVTEKEAAESELFSKSEKLKKTEDSLKEVQEISERRQLKIDLLNKDKELSELKIKEQNARIKNEQLVLNSILLGAFLAGVLITVLLINYRRKIATNKKMHQQNVNIKSSINYAKRIQEAMLPHHEQWKRFADDSFILFKPRDVVSGDYYWFSEIKDGSLDPSIAFAAVDCTGHGVPGALMSMIGMNSLNGIVNRGITETDIILNTLHTEIRSALRQKETKNNDGMDIALCIYKPDEGKIEFSGAKNSIVYIQDATLHQIKGDVHPIGGSNNKDQLNFKKHEIAIDRPTYIYIFSDGYRDQFGGKDNTKFMSKRFNRMLMDIHKMEMRDQGEFLNKTIEEWKGSMPQTDDILIVGLKLNPATA